jgi:hypothetical protein
MSSFAIVPYDPGEHVAFVCDSFSKSTREVWPYSLIRHGDAVRGFRELLANPRVRAVVAVVEGVQVGWAASLGGRLVHAFVKPDYRKHGIAGQLVTALQLDPKDLEVLVWTFKCVKLDRAAPGRVRLAIAEELSQ